MAAQASLQPFCVALSGLGRVAGFSHGDALGLKCRPFRTKHRPPQASRTPDHDACLPLLGNGLHG